MTRRRVAALAVLAAVAAGAAGGVRHAGRWLVVDRPMMGPQAIVSLGSHEWERLPETARLAQVFPRAVVLLTQPAVVTPLNCHDCANRSRRLAALGVPPKQLRLLERRVRSTYDEALAVQDFVRQTGATRILVVTSRYHTRRALAVFRHVLGPRVSVGVAGAPWPAAVPERWWSTAYGRWYVRHEWAAVLYYISRRPGLLRHLG